MQPIKITILGDFWDSQLYKGRLYLWGMDNSLQVINWEQLVSSLTTESYLDLALNCAFVRGDLLYRTQEFSVIFDDKEIRKILAHKFEQAADRDFVINGSELEQLAMGKQPNMVNELPDDTLLYNDSIFALTASGLFTAGIHKNRRNVFMADQRALKRWDGQGVHLQASSGHLAIAAASDGLFEMNLVEPTNQPTNNEPMQISSNHTLFANYMFASVYGSSDIAPGYLAAFQWITDDSLPIGSRGPYLKRQFARNISEASIFGDTKKAAKRHHSLTFGSQEKLYRIDGDNVTAIDYTQKWAAEEDKQDKAFHNLGSRKRTAPSKAGQAIAGAAISFGLVTEFEDALWVLTSDNESHIIKGPITRWRVFPRSIRYENQLHIIMEDRVCIYSFNQDFFVNRYDKFIGTNFKVKKYDGAYSK